MTQPERFRLDKDAIYPILAECGYHPPTGGSIGVLRLIDIPDGLNAKVTERYLREHAAQLIGGSWRV